MSSAAWAVDVAFVKDAVIGTEDNSGGWWSGTTTVMDIPANKTLTLKFKTYSATDAQLSAASAGAWGAHMSHIIRIGYTDGSKDHYLFWRADGYGWLDGEKIGDKSATTNSNETNDNSWVTCNESNMRWGTDGAEFREDITGSDVTVTIMRKGTDLIIIQDYEATSGKYRRYFVMNTGADTETRWLWAQMVVEHAHIVASENYTITDTNLPLTGTIVGKLNKSGRLANHGNIENFTVAPNGSLSLRFVLHSTKLFDWGQWLYEIADASDLYTLSVGNQASWNALKVGESITKSANWPATTAELLEKMDGATIDMTVTRTGATVSMTAVHHPVSGDDFSITASVTPTKEGFATSNITVRPLVELGYLDLLPVTFNMNAYGWATFASDYPLDFSKATTGLTAYTITGHSDKTILKGEVTGTVPAGTPLLLKGDANESYNIPIVGTNTTDLGTNLLVRGTGAAVDAGSGVTRYVLVVNGGNAEFQKIEATPATVDRGKAYLQFNEVISARELTFDFDSETTAISELTNTNLTNYTNEYFNLAGQRVANPTKGLYIVNGKKVVVK